MAKIFDNLRQKVKEFFVGYDPAEDLDVYSEDLYEKILHEDHGETKITKRDQGFFDLAISRNLHAVSLSGLISTAFLKSKYARSYSFFLS